jgi:hypothetical protein
MTDKHNQGSKEEGIPVEQGEMEAANAELEALRVEVAELRQQASVAGSPPEREIGKHRGRRWAVGLLIAFGCILLAGANLTFWLRDTVLNTNGWVTAVGPLSRSPVIAEAVSNYVVVGLFDLVEVDQIIQEALPSEARFLSGPLSGVLQDLVRDLVTDVIQSDEFNAVWVGVNRVAHETIISVLRGDGSLLYIRGGKLTVDLGDIFDFVQSTLGLRDLNLFAADDWSAFVLLESQQVAAVQEALAFLDSIGLVLPLLALGTLVLAWFVSLWRRRTVLWIGVGVAITMALSLILFGLARPALLISIADPLVRVVAKELWKVVTRGLLIQTIFLLVVGVLLVLGATLAGPSPRAVAIRTAVSDRFGRLTE